MTNKPKWLVEWQSQQTTQEYVDKTKPEKKLKKVRKRKPPTSYYKCDTCGMDYYSWKKTSKRDYCDFCDRTIEQLVQEQRDAFKWAHANAKEKRY